MRKNKLMAMLLAGCVFTGILTGCSSSGEQSSEPAQSTGTQESTEAKQDNGESVTITFWDMPWGPSEYTAKAQELVGEFEKEYPNIKVDYQSIPWDGWAQTFMTAVSSNSGPDVSTGAAFLQNRLALMGEVADVDSIIDEYEAEGKLDDFVPGTIDNFVWEGHQIALPYNVDCRLMWYRKDLFEAANVEVPTNWDEFLEAAKALTTDDCYGFVTAGTDASAQWTMLQWALNNGGGYLDADANADMVNEKTVEALAFVKELKDAGVIPPGAAGYTGADATKLLYQGKAAMVIAAPAIIGEMPEDVIDNIEVMDPLTSPAGLATNPASTNGLILYSDSKHQEEAKIFMKWWSDNSLVLWSEGNMGAFPARVSLMENDFFKNDRLRNEVAEKIMPTVTVINYPVGSARAEMDIFDGEYFFRDALQGVLASDQEPEEILKELNERYQKAIDEMRQSTVNN